MAKTKTEEKQAAKVSMGAFSRLMALRKVQNDAAKRIRAGDDYPDFFVEGSGPPWHERWPEVISGKTFSDDRMVFIDRLAQDDYPDFFVEGSGPPWNERWPEVITGQSFDPTNVQHRIRALKGLDVFKAFLQLRERATRG